MQVSVLLSQAQVFTWEMHCFSFLWPGLQSHSRCLGPHKNDLKRIFLCFLAFAVMYDGIFRYINANPEAKGVPFRKTKKH